MKNLFNTRSAKTQKQNTRFIFISFMGESFSDPEKDSPVSLKTKEDVINTKAEENPNEGFPNLAECVSDVLDEEPQTD